MVVLRINVDLAIFQPYLDSEAGDNQSLKIQVARPGIEPRSSCSASQELNHSDNAAPQWVSKTTLNKGAVKHLEMHISVNVKKQVNNCVTSGDGWVGDHIPVLRKLRACSLYHNAPLVLVCRRIRKRKSKTAASV